MVQQSSKHVPVNQKGSPHSTELLQNEIRDFLYRAPKRLSRSGTRLSNNASVRYRWLAEISAGTIHERIERRNGTLQAYGDFLVAVRKSVRRYHRKTQA